MGRGVSADAGVSVAAFGVLVCAGDTPVPAIADAEIGVNDAIEVRLAVGAAAKVGPETFVLVSATAEAVSIWPAAAAFSGITNAVACGPWDETVKFRSAGGAAAGPEVAVRVGGGRGVSPECSGVMTSNTFVSVGPQAASTTSSRMSSPPFSRRARPNHFTATRTR